MNFLCFGYPAFVIDGSKLILYLVTLLFNNIWKDFDQKKQTSNEESNVRNSWSYRQIQ